MSTSLLAQALAKLGELATNLGTAITNIAGVQATANTIRNDITSARDNVNATTNAARDNVKAHVTTAVNGLAGKAPVKRVQNGVITIFGSITTGSVTVASVNPAACVVTISPGVTESGTIDSTVSSWTLTANNLTINRSQAGSGSRTFSWSIVEYNTNIG